KIMEALQADFRKVGADLVIQLYDPTVAWGKLATQEFDLFGMSFPYVSAGDALNLYFRSENMPTPNRMNWDDPDTDRLLDEGKTATTPDVRAAAYGEVLEKVHDAAVWIPLYHEPMRLAQSSRMAPVKPHNIYGCGLYKGLDFQFIN
ncbi:MAG: ABC transporter substrate-binding protein, partial [Pseudomonadota bacterium]